LICGTLLGCLLSTQLSLSASGYMMVRNGA
jgi:hypothetical protein